MVYYLNSQNELRVFLDDPRLVPDTNRSERAVRTLTVLRAASGFKQSPEFADSMCGWLQHVIDETHTRLGDHLNPDRKLLQYDPDALASFDVTPWLPWNYVKRIKKEQE